jgi:predicted Zn finger-like uncharacterized protein
MPIAVTCPACKHSGRVPDQALGRKIKCPKCGKPFMVEADGAAPLSSSAPAVEPPAPAGQQQPLPSAFDFGETPPPAPGKTPPPTPRPKAEEPKAKAEEPKAKAEPPPEPESSESEEEEEAAASDLPWFYGFLETYAKVAMILGVVLATIALLCEIGFSVMTLMASREGMMLGIIAMVGALIAYLLAILLMLLLTALVLMLVDMARNIREVRRMGEQRRTGSPPPPERG